MCVLELKCYVSFQHITFYWMTAFRLIVTEFKLGSKETYGSGKLNVVSWALGN